MDDFYAFLNEKWINKNLYKVNKVDINDIYLISKTINQHYTSEWKQNKEKSREWLEENKKEISKNNIFDKNSLNIWKNIIFWVEPETFTFWDCLTCDWHWEIECKKCEWNWELICPICNWKTYIEKKEILTETKENICNVCNGSGNLINTCNKCHWKGVIEKKERCFSCNWKWIDINWRPCQNCRWQWFLIKTEKCNLCVGWTITRKCNKCQGKWKIIEIIKIENKKNIKCSNCNETWRVLCTTCWWNRKTICPTCHGERKTFQYLLNKFEIDVDLKPILINNKSLNEEKWLINILKILPYSKIIKITEEEKEEILRLSREENIKVNDKNLWKLNWTLFRFQHLETWLRYFVFFNKKNNQFYYTNLPPKSNLEAKLDKYFEIFMKYFLKIKNKLINWYYNRKNY